MIGYHFTGDALRDGRPIPPVGEWLVHAGSVVPCESGLHASEHPFDALQYAPGCLLHHVELEGDIVPHGDPVNKYVGRRRKILATIDATAMLQEFARWCAAQVLHLWDAPQVVRDYLTAGDETLRVAAWLAAQKVAQVVGRAAARYAVWDAARDAAEDAAGVAARVAERDAAGYTAEVAARVAARIAARIAAEDTAWNVTWNAAGDAAQDAQRRKFAEMVEAAFKLAEGGSND